MVETSFKKIKNEKTVSDSLIVFDETQFLTR